MSVGANARTFILKTEEGEATHRRFLNGTTAKSEGDMVTLTSNVLEAVADSNLVGAVGVCATDIAASAYGTVYLTGMFNGEAATGADFGIGDFVYNADATELDTGTNGDVPVGKVVHTDPASGGTVHFELWSIILKQIDVKA